ncbi:HEAT repeat domain-containing protein [Candidatus Poribacteria bacterium]|nr:HEAT repeat domain-containing protein [Candidatus Poribacteria bacterium]
MYKYLGAILSFTVFFLISLSSAHGDIIKMKNGAAHKGEITAEEDKRVQMKIEGSGARIWFMRDQVLSIEKDSPKETTQGAVNDKSDPPSDKASTGDDVARAQELLDKMREQPKETPTTKKKSTKPTSTKQTDQSTGSAPAISQSEIEKLIEQLRKGEYYDRLDACKKIGTLGSKDAIPHLIHVLDDEDFYLRTAANESLIKITGQNFGFDAKANRSVRMDAVGKWEKWYKQEQKKEAGTQFKSFW